MYQREGFLLARRFFGGTEYDGGSERIGMGLGQLSFKKKWKRKKEQLTTRKNAPKGKREKISNLRTNYCVNFFGQSRDLNL